VARSRQKLKAFGGNTSFFQALMREEKILVRITPHPAPLKFLYIGWVWGHEHASTTKVLF